MRFICVVNISCRLWWLYCGECMIFISGSPGKSGISSVDDFPDNALELEYMEVVSLEDGNHTALRVRSCGPALCRDFKVH